MGQERASALAIVEESTAGILETTIVAGDFIPFRPGSNPVPSKEELENDEIQNDVGKSKTLTGKENPTGTINAYLKNSEVEGQLPNWGLLLKSAMGALSTAGAEFNTVAGSTTGTSAVRAVVNVDAAEGATFEEGEALLIKDSTNGYSIRNIFSISTDALSLNFNLDNAPGVGVDLGKANLIKPALTHPAYSIWKYIGGGDAILALAGNKSSNVSVSMPAGQQAEISFDHAGTEQFWNPITIDATNNKVNFTDDVGTVTATLTNKTYKSPLAIAAEIASKMTAASVGSGNDTITCTYVSYGTDIGKFIIASDGGVLFSILWKTGANGADGTDTHFGTIIGYSDAADDTGAFTYTGDNSITLTNPLTPAFDDATNLIFKNADFMIGDFSDNVCRSVNDVSFTIATPVTDVNDACAETGLEERLILERDVELVAVLNLKPHESHLFDKWLNNSDVEVMCNVGSKDSSGNWEPGKVVNFYMQAATITQHQTQGDEVKELQITAKGFVNSTKKDIFINFI